MGQDVSCPCNRVDIVEEAKETQEDLMEKVFKGKLNKKEILIEYFNEQTKVCLIKTDHIKDFFENRNLTRIDNKKYYMKYYNSVLISNYLAKNDLTLIILLDSPFKSTFKKDITGSNAVFKTPGSDNSGNYLVEFLSLVGNSPDHVIKQLRHNLLLNLKKNYCFIGITNDSPNDKRQFKILYKMHYHSYQGKIEYDVQIYKGELDEKGIDNIIKKPENKYKRLKAIMIDFTLYINDSVIDYLENSNDFPKQNVKCNDVFKNFKYYYFIFDEVVGDETEQEYMTLKIEIKNAPTDVYLQDVSIKINDTLDNLNLSCIVSDEKTMYFIFNTTTIGEDFDNTDEDIDEEINQLYNKHYNKIKENSEISNNNNSNKNKIYES